MSTIAPFLQPFLFLLTFFLVLPGRDTQDAFFVLDRDFWSCMAAVPLQFLCPVFDVLLSALHSVFCVLRVLASLFLGGIHHALIPTARHSHVRKHGRWRHFRFFPRCCLLLSSVMPCHHQVPSALSFSPEHARLRRHSPNLSSSDNMFDPSQVFKMSVDPALSPDAFFHPEIFECLPFDTCADDDNIIPPSLLHLSGHASEWAREMTILDPHAVSANDDTDTISVDSSMPSLLSNGSSDSESEDSSQQSRRCSETSDAPFASFRRSAPDLPIPLHLLEEMDPVLEHLQEWILPLKRSNGVDKKKKNYCI